jgi:O-antigen/teichoic acid export membrane protein
VAVLFAGRFIAWAVHLIFCFRAFPALRHTFRINKADIFPLFRFGGFITLSNIIGPLMSYMDRFLIGSLASIAAVAYYTTPYEIVTKLWIFPAAIVGVLFPAFSSCFKYDNPRAVQLFQAGIKYTLIGLFPLVFPLIMLAPEGMRLWLGPEFAAQSSRILQWMAIGIFLNCFAQIPFALIQAAGKPNWAALMYALQFPFYILAIWLMLGYAGIEGVAIAWLIRVVIDSTVLFFLSERLMPGLSGMDRSFHIMIALALLLTLGACIPMPLAAKFAAIALVLPGFAAASWLTLLTETERSFAAKSWRALRQISFNNRQAL